MSLFTFRSFFLCFSTLVLISGCTPSEKIPAGYYKVKHQLFSNPEYQYKHRQYELTTADGKHLTLIEDGLYSEEVQFTLKYKDQQLILTGYFLQLEAICRETESQMPFFWFTDRSGGNVDDNELLSVGLVGDELTDMGSTLYSGGAAEAHDLLNCDIAQKPLPLNYDSLLSSSAVFSPCSCDGDIYVPHPRYDLEEWLDYINASPEEREEWREQFSDNL
ncbi:hypothetical protein ACWJJH_19705 [Endozoicomonadaceae bacterium StTr2]